MKTLNKALVLLCAPIGIYAVPLLGSLEGVEREAFEYGSRPVSTELTLGHSGGRTTGDQGGTLWKPQPVWMWKPRLGAEIYAPSHTGQSLFSHSSTSPFQTPPRSSGAAADTATSLESHVAGSNPSAHAAQNSHSAPRIDPNFSELIQDPQRGRSRLWLPQELTYVRSPWLHGAYEALVGQSLERRRFDTSEVVLPAARLAELLQRTRGIFAARGSIYILRVPINLMAPLSGSIEVMFKRNKVIDLFDGKGVHLHTVSFWTTTDHGTRLALLGIYHISPSAFEELTTSPGIQKFAMYRAFRTPQDPQKSFFLQPSAS